MRRSIASGLLVCALGLFVFPSFVCADDGRMLGVTWLGRLYELDLTSGAATDLGSTGISRLNSLALRADGSLWTSVAGDPDEGTPARLYSIDPVTVTATLEAELDPQWDFRGMTFSDDGALIAIQDGGGSFDPDSIVRVDLALGSVITLNTFPSADGIQSLTTAPDGRLVAWDLRDGVYTLNDDGFGIIGSTPSFTGSQSIQSLAYTPDGRLFGSSGTLSIDQPFGQGGLYGFNQSDTPEFIGEHGVPFEMRGMAYIPGPGTLVLLIAAPFMARPRR